ncbi:MAG: NAD-dependent epimerase/dehydratase family protein [Pseudomonadota bacterium]
MSKVIILGAKGRFGRAATQAFLKAGWEVSVFGRRWAGRAPERTTVFTGDATDPAALIAACKGHDLIVNAINPPYEDWSRELPKITAAVIAAARASEATVIIPGNVYNYGANAPQHLNEKTAWAPTSRKGALRVEMEQAYRAAMVRTLVIRGGDYLERAKSGNWFDAQIAAQAHAGKVVYPGALDRVHAWAYLPDMARAAVMLAEIRGRFSAFEEFCFEGYSLTGAELVDQIAEATGKAQRVRGLPWFLVKLLGLIQPTMREIVEMRYLWNIPHRLDGAKLAKALPDFAPTPLGEAMKDVLAA